MAHPHGKPYKELRLRQLRTFCECVRHKSFSAAARALHISQPVVWQQVRALERELGVTLLLRRGREWEPSEDGRLLFELAGAIVASMDSLLETFAERRGDLPRTLVVAGMPSVFIEELAESVVAFCQQHPKIQTSLLTGPNPQVLELVSTGEADLGVVQFAGVVPSDRIESRQPHLVSELLCLRQWSLVVPKGHPLATKRQLRPPDIVHYPLILEGTEFPWRKQVDELFRSVGLLDQLQVVLQINNALAARRYVSLGLGITVLPQPRGGLHFPNLCVRPLDGMFPAEQVIALWRRGATPRPQARLFIDFVREHLAK